MFTISNNTENHFWCAPLHKSLLECVSPGFHKFFKNPGHRSKLRSHTWQHVTWSKFNTEDPQFSSDQCISLSMIRACELIHISVPKSKVKYHNFVQNIRRHGKIFSRRDHQTPGIREFLYKTQIIWHIQKLWPRSCPWKVPFIITPFLSPSVRMKSSNRWIFFRKILTFGDIIEICWHFSLP